jgi:hypothetical protein
MRILGFSKHWAKLDMLVLPPFVMLGEIKIGLLARL